MHRQLSLLDKIIVELDFALRTNHARAPKAKRGSPAEQVSEQSLSDSEKKHAAGLMRVNHSGEVCAQALYRGQATTAKLPKVRREMELAADEEIDHLAWCEQRISELGSNPSVLNPLWYGLSFAIGASAGIISDRLSLGFVAATEDQVCKHLSSHLEKLPATDDKSRAIVTVMLDDEAKHSHAALSAGGLPFPGPAKSLMTTISKLMTETSYRF